jgi:phage protein D
MNEDATRNRSSLLSATRPTIKVDGTVEPRLNETLIDVMVEETSQGLFRCEARFANWGTRPQGAVGFLFFDGEILDFGEAFAVEIGEPGAAQQIFNGRIMGIEAQYPAGRPPQIVILAEDRFQDLRMTRRTRTFSDFSASDVVQEIASDHGLQAEIVLVESDPIREILAQLNRSDLAFLRELAASVDAETWVEDDTLHFQAWTARDAGTIRLAYGKNLREFAVLADLAHQRSSVGVSGWNVANKEPINAAAGEESISGELNGLRSGGEILEQALGARHEQIVHSGPSDQAEAEVTAQYEYRRRARRFVTGTGTADGQANMRVGSHVELRGLGDYFNGTYYVRLVRHVFDSVDGYHTIFEVERPGIGETS